MEAARAKTQGLTLWCDRREGWRKPAYRGERAVWPGQYYSAVEVAGRCSECGAGAEPAGDNQAMIDGGGYTASEISFHAGVHEGAEDAAP